MLLSFLGVSFSFEIASKDSATRSRRFQFIRFQSPLCQNMSFNPLFAKILVSTPSWQISIFVCRCVRNTTRRTRRMWTTNMLCKLPQVLTINCQTWHRLFSGHGEEYFYEDDGMWTSLCMALSSPDLNVGIIFNFCLLKSSSSAQNLTYM